MDEDASPILEVEIDRDGRVIVTLDEGAGDPAIPGCCATCLGVATKRVRPSFMLELTFPQCEACIPQPTPRGRRVAAILTGCLFLLYVSWWVVRRLRSRVPPWVIVLLAGAGVFAILVALVREGRRKLQGREGVDLLLSESDTVRLAFANPEYARRFLEANGVSGDLLQGA